MLIASKYEEIYSPELSDFIYITDNAYTRKEILTMKHHMLTTLNFDFTGYPSSYRFWERLVKVAKCNDTMKFLS
jgi:hypothetical protein